LKRGFDGSAYQSSQPGVFSNGMCGLFVYGASSLFPPPCGEENPLLLQRLAQQVVPAYAGTHTAESIRIVIR
jgi:hypothetical protein